MIGSIFFQERCWQISFLDPQGSRNSVVVIAISKPRSCDSEPRDDFLSGFVKSHVYARNRQTIPEFMNGATQDKYLSLYPLIVILLKN